MAFGSSRSRIRRADRFRESPRSPTTADGASVTQPHDGLLPRFAVGVDIGGTSIKASLVDVTTGERAARRFAVANPLGKEPEDFAEAIAGIVRDVSPIAGTPVGVGFPGIVRGGVVRQTTHVSQRWVGLDAQALLSEATGVDVVVVNDADAAGVAEREFGAMRGREGLLLLTTLGTGIGTALVHEGVVIPNSELGHLHIDGPDFEPQVGFSAVRREGITLEEWAGRLSVYYRHLEMLLSPQLFVIGGAAAHVFDEFARFLDIGTEIVPARFGNDAGFTGAAMVAVSPDRLAPWYRSTRGARLDPGAPAIAD
ncbi:polyphosphate glucokinase [Rathayibacter sp. AY1E9]|nr:polyphosphate glucokinase [Rathayibacter sp. AY1E6]PPG54445.1 polyphosphate glucokinase [Rathayibacter sp. AY1E9]PPG61183.1 polyphosphate glucokinase [Rathayibacter sp. AY1C5]PPH40663.1 polyphosphate glucokinase [Rathayibacter sp. AY1E4]PPH90844.1 polyphosphate glucokinase [Rathayibacter sp. AY1D5]